MKRLIAFPVAILSAVMYAVFWCLCAFFEFIAFLNYELYEIAADWFSWAMGALAKPDNR